MLIFIIFSQINKYIDGNNFSAIKWWNILNSQGCSVFRQLIACEKVTEEWTKEVGFLFNTLISNSKGVLSFSYAYLLSI